MTFPALVGIVNVTPDSFSGDGRMGEAALAHAAKLVADGASILDIGAESTRPGATPLAADEEWIRLSPVLRTLGDQPWRNKLRLSIDTRHARTAQQALELGADIINDVGALRDPAMAAVLSESNCGIVVMHALTIPADSAVTWPSTIDPITALLDWKKKIRASAISLDIAPARLIFDPGIGFGKTAGQSLAVMLGAQALVASGDRWLFGHSRKSFLTLFGDGPAGQRDALTLAFSSMLAASGVQYLRVHDVASHRTLAERLCT